MMHDGSKRAGVGWEVVGISIPELVDGSREAAERRNKWGQEAKGFRGGGRRHKALAHIPGALRY
jgi:hypothetical protein